MKKLLAVILVLVTLFSMCAPLAGCASFTPMQMGAWLSLIADSFGMVSYTSKQPYFEQVDPSDTYFDAFQLAAEWEILAPDSAVSSGTQVTWKDVLVTLVNAGEFLSVDATEEEKIAFAIANFDPEIRTYWMNRNIRVSEAIPLLDKAAQMWADKTYTEKVEEYTFADGVVSLLDEQGLDYTRDENVVVIDADKVAGLKPGDVYVLPNSASGAECGINQVASIEIDGDKAIITNEPEIVIDETTGQVQTMRVQETSSLDMNNITGIYDADGNPLYTASEGVNTALASISGDEFDGVYVSTLESRNTGMPEAVNAGFFDKAKGDLTFKLKDGLEAKLKVSANSLGIEITGEKKKDSHYRSRKQETTFSAELKDIVLTKDIDFSWGKLHSATVKLDYTTVLSLGVSYEKTRSVGEEYQESDGRLMMSSLSAIKSGLSQMLGNIKQDVYETKYDNKSIYICKLRILQGGVCSLDFIVKAKMTAAGEYKLTLSLSGAKGVQYKNGNLRYINSGQPSLQLSGEGSVEFTLCPGLELSFMEKVVKVSVTGDLGGGAKFSAEVHLVDAQWHKLYTGDAVLTEEDAEALNGITYHTSADDILAVAEASGGTWNDYKEGASVEILPKACVEAALYPIVRISGEIEFFERLGAGGSYEFIGDKDTLAKLHFDIAWNMGPVGGGFDPGLSVGRECTYDFKPWDVSEDAIEEMEESTTHDPSAPTFETIQNSDTIMFSDMRVFLNKGESKAITLTQIPAGYSPGDLVVESEDKKIAKLDIKSGKVYAGEKAGTVQIVIKTPDGKYTAVIFVTVNDDQQNNFQGISGTVGGSSI